VRNRNAAGPGAHLDELRTELNTENFMSMKLFELKQQHTHALNKADSILRAAETAGRELTDAESMDVDMCMAAVNTLKPQIAEIESKNTLSKHLVNGKLIPGGPAEGSTTVNERWRKPAAKRLSGDYLDAFVSFLSSGGQNASAALYEGSNSAGGYAVPLVVDDQIVPLAGSDMGVRKLATILPTSSDIRVPRQTAVSTAAAKAESGGSSNAFTESDPALDQFTLSSFMAGVQHTLSWELVQDVPAFQAFAINDMLLAQNTFEENWFVNGTGTGQAQGLIGNTGAGVTGVLVGTDNYASELFAATFDVQGLLKAAYHPGASWLMSRATGVALRKQQMQSNLFAPVFTRVGDQDYLHGYPVEYSASMPAIGAGNTPVVFGNFKAGYVVGDRGGSGINVKILDQPLATQGQIILLAYRRTDGRVRRSEAIQAITLHS
jgi:HK97 family phage major capsid protein